MVGFGSNLVPMLTQLFFQKYICFSLFNHYVLLIDTSGFVDESRVFTHNTNVSKPFTHNSDKSKAFTHNSDKSEVFTHHTNVSQNFSQSADVSSVNTLTCLKPSPRRLLAPHNSPLHQSCYTSVPFEYELQQALTAACFL